MLRKFITQCLRMVAAPANKATRSARRTRGPSSVVPGLLADTCRSRAELIAENAFLRQQLIVAARAVKRPTLRRHERGLLVLLTTFLPRWRDAVLLVKPETVLRWRRAGFRLFWAWRSRSRSTARPRPCLAQQSIDLIDGMARDNRLWGAERIRGELLKLGIRVSKRTIQKYMRGARTPPRRARQSWRTFLRNHAVWACDFLQTYDVYFRPIFAFFIIDVNLKHVLHVAVTAAPSRQWTAQQLREATPFGQGPRFIIRDRDDKFGQVFDRIAQGVGARVLKIAVRAPLMNAVCERFLGSVRRECLDHLIILGERHLLDVLREYVSYFNRARPHQGIGQRIPRPQACAPPPPGCRIEAKPVLGGLHHDYRAAA